MVYQADFYLKDLRICSIWTQQSDEVGIYKELAEPLFRHGCQKGMNVEYQKYIYYKSLQRLVADKAKGEMSGEDISAMVSSFLLVKKFELLPYQDMEIVIVKDKFKKKEKDAFVSKKHYVRKVIETNVRSVVPKEHSEARSEKRTQGRKPKTKGL